MGVVEQLDASMGLPFVSEREAVARGSTPVEDRNKNFSFWVHPWAVAKSDGSFTPPIYPYALVYSVSTNLLHLVFHSPPRPFLFICILPALSSLQEPGLWIRAYHANRSMLRHDGLNCVLLPMLLRETS